MLWELNHSVIWFLFLWSFGFGLMSLSQAEQSFSGEFSINFEPDTILHFDNYNKQGSLFRASGTNYKTKPKDCATGYWDTDSEAESEMGESKTKTSKIPNPFDSDPEPDVNTNRNGRGKRSKSKHHDRMLLSTKKIKMYLSKSKVKRKRKEETVLQ